MSSKPDQWNMNEVASGAVSREAVDAGRLKGSRLISRAIVDWWIYEFMQPLENFFVRYRVHPNTLSYTGLALTILGGILLAQGHLIWGGWTVIFAGCFDFFDGRVARRTNQMTVQGAFLDSVLDRYMDAAVFFGLAYYYRSHWFFYIVLLAILGSTTTPYIRAKAESLGLKSAEGAMQRPERVLYLGLGSAFGGYAMVLSYPFSERGQETLPWLQMLAVGLVALFSNMTSLQRLRTGYRELGARGKA